MFNENGPGADNANWHPADTGAKRQPETVDVMNAGERVGSAEITREVEGDTFSPIKETVYKDVDGQVTSTMERENVQVGKVWRSVHDVRRGPDGQVKGDHTAEWNDDGEPTSEVTTLENGSKLAKIYQYDKQRRYVGFTQVESDSNGRQVRRTSQENLIHGQDGNMVTISTSQQEGDSEPLKRQGTYMRGPEHSDTAENFQGNQWPY